MSAARVVELPATLDHLPSFSVMVTLNDGERCELIEMAACRGVSIFAEVQGVQDFEDADTGRRRHPHRRADYVRYQCSDDVCSLGGTRGAVVGNTRLERIARPPEREFGDTARIIMRTHALSALSSHRLRIRTSRTKC